MTELEQRLYALGQAMEFPETPEFAHAVRRRLSVPRPRYFDSRRLAIAAALLIATVGAALLAFPSTRDAIAGFFGLKGVLIERVPTNPSAAVSAPVSVADRLGLGRQTTLEAAQAVLPYSIVYPQTLGSPDAVFLMPSPATNAVALIWKPRSGLPQAATTGVGALLIEFPGQVQPDYFVKMLGPDATVEPVKVKGAPGYWISGKPHGFFFLDPQGVTEEDTFRLAGNTVIWDQGSLTIRIESGLSRTQALELANSTD